MRKMPQGILLSEAESRSSDVQDMVLAVVRERAAKTPTLLTRRGIQAKVGSGQATSREVNQALKALMKRGALFSPMGPTGKNAMFRLVEASTDRRIRDLERAAASGDPDAERRLRRALLRGGQTANVILRVHDRMQAHRGQLQRLEWRTVPAGEARDVGPGKRVHSFWRELAEDAVALVMGPWASQRELDGMLPANAVIVVGLGDKPLAAAHLDFQVESDPDYISEPTFMAQVASWENYGGALGGKYTSMSKSWDRAEAAAKRAGGKIIGKPKL